MLDKFLGQRDALTPLITAIQAHRVTGKPMPHALFLGRPGTGKTTLAKVLADELNVPFVTVHAPSIRDAHGVKERDQMAKHIQDAKGGILHVDEIHALSRTLAEDMYRVIDEGLMTVSRKEVVTAYKVAPMWITAEDQLPDNMKWMWPISKVGYYSVPVAFTREGKDTATELVDVSPITVIGSTTDEALLPQAFLSRLSALTVRLRPYTKDELAQIAVRHANDLGTTIKPKAAVAIALRSRETPRRVKQLVDRTYDHAVAHGNGDHQIYADDVYETMEFLGVDEYGLEQPHRDMLNLLRVNERGLSRTSLAQQLGIPVRNMEAHWADLTRAGFVQIATRHELTEKGKEAYNG